MLALSRVAARAVASSSRPALMSLARSMSLKEPFGGIQGAVPMGTVPMSPIYQKLQAKQKLWANNEDMVWRKTTADVTMYNVSVALVSAGVVYVFYLLYRMSFPAKKEE